LFVCLLKWDKELDRALHHDEKVELIPKTQAAIQGSLVGAPAPTAKAYERPNYPDSNSSSRHAEHKAASRNDSATSGRSVRSTGSQTLPRGVQANSFQLPPINAKQSTFQLRKAVPVAPVAPISPVLLV